MIDAENPQLIVSLTSYPHRFYQPGFIDNLKSLVDQHTIVRYRIVLNLFKDEADYLPVDVRKFVKDNHIEILKCRKNLKSHLKYFYCMKKYNDIPVMTVDDDVIYKSNMVDDMWKTHIDNPNRIITGRVFKMPKNENGLYCGIGQIYFKLNCKEDDLYQLGCSGALYPPEFCKSIDDRLLNIIPYWIDDDALLWIISNIAGTKVMMAVSSEELEDGKPYWAGIFCNGYLPVSADKFSLVVSKSGLYAQYVQFYNCGTVDELVESVLNAKDTLKI